MLIHEKLMAGQFLLDMTNERSGLLQTAATHPQQTLNLLKSSSPIMPPLDIYAVYHQQLQQQHQQQLPQITAVTTLSRQSPLTAEALDLSRRNLAETNRKTPSPYHTSSSLGSGSPASSPNSLLNQHHQQSHSQLLPPPSLLHAAHHHQQTQNINSLPDLYPGLYFPAVVKKETNNVMESFASPANTSLKHDFSEPHSPPLVKQMSSDNVPASVSSSTRPFKAFPRDPLVIAANFAATDVLLDNPRVERYTEYRKRVLEQIRSSNGGSHTVSNPKMRRTSLASGSINEGSSSNTSENEERHHEESSDCDSNFDHDNNQQSTNKTSKTSENSANGSAGAIVKDAAYYERRRKNNAAAKKSRDRRRIKEDEIAIRAAYLERQNIELLCQLDALKAQLAALTK